MSSISCFLKFLNYFWAPTYFLLIPTKPISNISFLFSGTSLLCNFIRRGEKLGLQDDIRFEWQEKSLPNLVGLGLLSPNVFFNVTSKKSGVLEEKRSCAHCS